MKLKKKEKQLITGKVTKKHERAQTPYQRVITSDKLSQTIKDTVTAQYKTLNPAQLHRDLKKKLDKIYRIMKQKQLTSSVTVAYHATPLPDYLLGNT